jgi:hypothetical protein
MLKNQQSKEQWLNLIGKKKSNEGEITKQNQFKKWLKTKKIVIKRIRMKFEW